MNSLCLLTNLAGGLGSADRRCHLEWLKALTTAALMKKHRRMFCLPSCGNTVVTESRYCLAIRESV